MLVEIKDLPGGGAVLKFVCIKKEEYKEIKKLAEEAYDQGLITDEQLKNTCIDKRYKATGTGAKMRAWLTNAFMKGLDDLKE